MSVGTRLFGVAAACALVVGSGASAGPASPAAVHQFEGWTAACNNLGSCVVIGTAGDGSDLAYLRIARDAGADAPPRVLLVLAVPDGAKGPFTQFALSVTDAKGTSRLGPFAAKPAPDDPTYVSAAVPPGAESLVLVNAVRDAATLDLAIGGETATLGLKGLAAALRFIDDKQGRAGTPSALVAKGMTPVGQVPPPGQPPVVAPAPAGSVSELATPPITEALLAAPRLICDADTIKTHEDLKAWTVGPDRLLIAVPCQTGAYNFQSAYYFTDAAGGHVRPVLLPEPVGQGDDTAPNVLTNADFDPKTMELVAFDKGRGIGDCGSQTTWIWTGESFALLSASALDACPGAFSQDWPNLYTAVKP